MYKILYLPTNKYIPKYCPKLYRDCQHDKVFYTKDDATSYVRRFLKHLHSGPLDRNYEHLINAVLYGIRSSHNNKPFVLRLNFIDSSRVNKYVFSYLTALHYDTYLLQDDVTGFSSKKPKNIVDALFLLIWLEDINLELHSRSQSLALLDKSHFLVVKC